MTVEPLDLARERLHLVRGAFFPGPDQDTRRAPVDIEIVERRIPAGVAPVAFLAQINARCATSSARSGPPPRLPVADVDSVFPLKSGINRVGFDQIFGDYERPTFRSIESRQWLVLIAGGQAFVVDDHSTNGSFVLPRREPRLASDDPRYDPDCTGFGQPRSGMIQLDWEGSTVVGLSEGDVLITCYSALVFGWTTSAQSG